MLARSGALIRRDYNRRMPPAKRFYTAVSQAGTISDSSRSRRSVEAGAPGARLVVMSLLATAAIAFGLWGCSSVAPSPPVASTPTTPPPTLAPAVPAEGPASPTAPRLPERFESSDFIVVFAEAGDTPESLAKRYLGSSAKAWMIEDYREGGPLATGQKVIIPKREWNPPGIQSSGYQVVSVLAYGSIAAQRKGRLIVGAGDFEGQMRLLKADGYRAIRLDEYIAHLRQRRQLPKKSVIITFDEAHRGILQHVSPILRELGFPAVLFVPTSQISERPGAAVLSWAELRELSQAGIEVHAQSKTSRDLRRASGESDDAYSRRMQQELEQPLELIRKHLPRPSGDVETLAYPLGRVDDDVIRYARQYGYSAGFTLAGEVNPAFVSMFKIGRTRVYAEWTLADFKKSLLTFHDQTILPRRPPERGDGGSSDAVAEKSTRRQLAAPHHQWSEQLEDRGLLREALAECTIALTIDPTDAAAQERRAQLEKRIADETTRRVQEGFRVARSSPVDARAHFLAALALNPRSEEAFDALRTQRPAREEASPPGKFLSHTVRASDTAGSLADLYYGNRARAHAIEQANGLPPGAPLPIGQVLRIPEISGVPFLRPDR